MACAASTSARRRSGETLGAAMRTLSSTSRGPGSTGPVARGHAEEAAHIGAAARLDLQSGELDALASRRAWRCRWPCRPPDPRATASPAIDASPSPPSAAGRSVTTSRPLAVAGDDADAADPAAERRRVRLHARRRAGGEGYVPSGEPPRRCPLRAIVALPTDRAPDHRPLGATAHASARFPDDRSALAAARAGRWRGIRRETQAARTFGGRRHGRPADGRLRRPDLLLLLSAPSSTRSPSSTTCPLRPRRWTAALQGPLVSTLIVDALLLGLFAVQHSVMARPAFKRWWTRIVAPPIERTTYVLLASAALVVLFVFWRPLAQPIWNVAPGPVATAPDWRSRWSAGASC